MSNGPLTEHARIADRRDDQAATILQEIKAGERNASKLVYRGHKCRHVLAEVFPVAEGILVHQPVYRLSESMNEKASVPAGRENNTLDGNNTWKAQVYFLEQGYPNLQCDHIHDYRLDPETIKQHIADGKKTITI